MARGKHSRGGVLSSNEDWNLVGSSNSSSSSQAMSRTRFGGEGRPNLLKRMTEIECGLDGSETEANEDESQEDEEEDIEDDEEDEEDDDMMKKPAPSRVIVDISALEDAFTKHCACPDCKGPLNVVARTICLATS
jgi:hypothetical protein